MQNILVNDQINHENRKFSDSLKSIEAFVVGNLHILLLYYTQRISRVTMTNFLMRINIIIINVFSFCLNQISYFSSCVYIS